ncbi:MAG: HD-like signal output (HDOD) protein [Nitrospinales bacterium]|jgi:HD-like signal output (HDOD) protein
MNINELIQSETQIPSLPEMFYQFKQAIDDPESSFDEICEIVGNDPGLTARILRIVNSAFFGFSQQVETISHAIGTIGREQLNDLVLSTVVIDQFKNIPPTSLNMETFWKHSIACGLSARNLAFLKGEDNSERFFVAGLLHDIGRLVICIKLPSKVLEVSQRSKSKGETLHKAEFETMGFNHALVGSLLLKAWKLPKPLVEAVGFHHNPAKATEFSLEASMIHVADIITNTLDLGFQDEENSIIPTMDEFASERIQVPKDSSFPNIKKQVQKEFEQTVQIFLQAA